MNHLLGISMLAVALAAMTGGCTGTPAGTTGTGPEAATGTGTATAAHADAAAGADAYAEPGRGIAVRRVPGTHVVRDFKRSYLALDAWKLYPAAGSVGTPLVAVVLDGSNAVTSAEMRVGRSDAAADVQDCQVPPDEAMGPVDTVEVGGVPFAHVTLGDAAMSHYLSADSYRAVHGGACYAIDLIIAGTRPDVYDPPRTPPFSKDAATKVLAAALAAVHWQP